MSLENKLAKNMIRFGVKNLSEHSNQKLTLLSEQLKIKFKWVKAFRWDWSRGVAGHEDIPFSNYAQDIVTDKEEWDSYLEENEAQFLKVLHPSFVSNWEELKADPLHKGYAVAALEKFNDTYPTYKWKYAFCGSETEIETILRKEPRPPVGKPGTDFNGITAPIEFPVNGNGSTFFENNRFEPTQAFIDALETDVLSKIRETAKSMLYNKDMSSPKFHLRELEVLTSCSRYRNTQDAADKTFMQLSEDRNNAATTYIKNELTKLGVVIDENTSIRTNSNGHNKNLKTGLYDGSSGPNPPYPNSIPISGKEGDIWASEVYNRKTGDTKAEAKLNRAIEHRNEYGEPHKNPAMYDQYKYCIAGLMISANTGWTKDPAPEGGEESMPSYTILEYPIETKNYGVSFYSNPKYFGFGLKLPWFKLEGKSNWNKPRWWRKLTSTKTKKRKLSGTPCFEPFM